MVNMVEIFDICVFGGLLVYQVGAYRSAPELFDHNVSLDDVHMWNDQCYDFKNNSTKNRENL
jgi:hypothetical protein